MYCNNILYILKYILKYYKYTYIKMKHIKNYNYKNILL